MIYQYTTYLQCYEISVIKTNIQYNGIFHLPIYFPQVSIQNAHTSHIFIVYCMQQQSSLRVQQYFHIFTSRSEVDVWPQNGTQWCHTTGFSKQNYIFFVWNIKSSNFKRLNISNKFEKSVAVVSRPVIPNKYIRFSPATSLWFK